MNCGRRRRRWLPFLGSGRGHGRGSSCVSPPLLLLVLSFTFARIVFAIVPQDSEEAARHLILFCLRVAPASLCRVVCNAEQFALRSAGPARFVMVGVSFRPCVVTTVTQRVPFETCSHNTSKRAKDLLSINTVGLKRRWAPVSGPPRNSNLLVPSAASSRESDGQETALSFSFIPPPLEEEEEGPCSSPPSALSLWRRAT